jgi:hypothetical protein
VVSDTEFERRSKALFDESVAGLNGELRSRLTQARHRALAEVPISRLQTMRRFWMPTAGLAATALIAVLVVMPYTRTERALPATFAAAEDMALLLNDDDLEMIEDMEFYAWLDSDPLALPEAPAPTSGGDANS